MSDGEPIRCVVRMARTEAGYNDSVDGSVFIAGNALELVPPDRAEGAFSARTHSGALRLLRLAPRPG